MNEIDPAQAARILAYVRDKGEQVVDAAADFTLLSGGNSHITWRLSTGGDGEDLVVKIAQPDGPLAPYDVGHEARMMDRAYRAGVPAPALVGYLQEGDTQFIVMRHVAGDSPSLWEVRKWLESQPEAARLKVGRTLLDVLPALSAAAPADVDLRTVYKAYLDRLVSRLEAEARGLITLPPSIAAAHHWLAERFDLFVGAAPVLHHGDFRLGNAVFRDGGIVAMLDWERAMPGHPLHDLGFLCLPGMRTGEHVGGILTEAELANIWQQVSGEAFDRRLVAYFRIMAIFSELCVMVRAMCRLAKGHGRLTGARPLPLIARLHGHMIDGIMGWNDGNFAL